MRSIVHVAVTLALLISAMPARGNDPSDAAGSQRARVLTFLRKNVIGKELAEPRETVVLKERELEAETLVTRKFTDLVETPHGFQFNILIDRKQTNYDLGPDGKRTGDSHAKGGLHVGRARLGERLSTGELIGILDEHYSADEDYPYSPSSLKMWVDEDKLLMECETIGYQDLYAREDQWSPGTIHLRYELWMSDEELHLKTVEQGFDLNVATGKRIKRPSRLTSVSIETDSGPVP